MNRNKSEKFIELADKRVNRALKEIQLIGNLSNRRNYEFTEQQAQSIIQVLQDELNAMKKSFQGNSQQQRKVFSVREGQKS